MYLCCYLHVLINGGDKGEIKDGGEKKHKKYKMTLLFHT